MTVEKLKATLIELADPSIAEHSQRFFKTGEGEYGEGDKFLGIRVPVLRNLAKQYRAIALHDIQQLLKSEFHEQRLFALLLLVQKFSKGDVRERTSIYTLYLANTRYINNWDLVDSSAYQIMGVYLADTGKAIQQQILSNLAKSDNLWERRIAIMATFHFIRNKQFEMTLMLSRMLLNDKEDLIHKAVGWMLREIGKRDRVTEKEFLQAHYKTMPRTMLRYAIEKFPDAERKRYLAGSV